MGIIAYTFKCLMILTGIGTISRKRLHAFLLICFAAAIPTYAFAGVDEGSIFLQARYPASELDLRLSDLQRGWWKRYVINPDKDTKRKHPLITQAGAGIQLDYFGDDRITATGWVSKLNGFLKLSIRERKQLVINILNLVKSSMLGTVLLVDKQTGRISHKALGNRYIKLSVIISSVTKNTKNENIRLFLPLDIGVGQAGYKDGNFVYSEAYFLKLQVNSGLAVSGDPGKFIVEHE